jgi:hypothetical protein
MQRDDYDADESEPEPLPERLDPDVPEADAIEQFQSAAPAMVDDEPFSLPPDAAEADALDQWRDAGVDDDFETE